MKLEDVEGILELLPGVQRHPELPGLRVGAAQPPPAHLSNQELRAMWHLDDFDESNLL